MDNTAEALQSRSLAAGASPGLQKHRSEELAGLSSYTEGEEDDEDLEEGTLDDIDEDDDADASPSWHVRGALHHNRSLTAASHVYQPMLNV